MELKKESFLIVGLGNPGSSYQATRHNIGYMVVERFAKDLEICFNKDNRFKSKVGKGVFEGTCLHLLLPETYMNLSGEAVKSYCDYYKLYPLQLLVVTDDVNLPFSELRLRSAGSSGGHNGLKSIEGCLGTRIYSRLRIGVGSPVNGQDLADYVLANFAESEKDQLKEVIDRSVAVLKSVLVSGITAAIQATNGCQIKKAPEDLTKHPLKGSGEEHES